MNIKLSKNRVLIYLATVALIAAVITSCVANSGLYRGSEAAYYGLKAAVLILLAAPVLSIALVHWLMRRQHTEEEKIFRVDKRKPDLILYVNKDLH